MQRNSPTLLGTDVVDQIVALEQLPGNELQVHGSGQLVKTVLAHGLVDEHQFLIYPVVLNQGRRLLDGLSAPAAFRLTESRMTSSGVLAATYLRVGRPTYVSSAVAPEPEQHRLLR
ncbi:dihydrofolate reductase family protein [Nocardia sp. BSTN01]|uniref:dihydrofolate reductase family protein n=1 Tax=Nocardia sp. BSTN01 TaxID=2783665 RepID=UPI00188FF77A|nr:dihydrofolate reductase family protein [Nocardia sp. BSTN01]MBF4996503.1 dihydrofolate reductase family protein [Nocardia sp. BSTN01]